MKFIIVIFLCAMIIVYNSYKPYETFVSYQIIYAEQVQVPMSNYIKFDKLMNATKEEYNLIIPHSTDPDTGAITDYSVNLYRDLSGSALYTSSNNLDYKYLSDQIIPHSQLIDPWGRTQKIKINEMFAVSQESINNNSVTLELRKNINQNTGTFFSNFDENARNPDDYNFFVLGNEQVLSEYDLETCSRDEEQKKICKKTPLSTRNVNKNFVLSSKDMFPTKENPINTLRLVKRL